MGSLLGMLLFSFHFSRRGWKSRVCRKSRPARAPPNPSPGVHSVGSYDPLGLDRHRATRSRELPCAASLSLFHRPIPFDLATNATSYSYVKERETLLARLSSNGGSSVSVSTSHPLADDDSSLKAELLETKSEFEAYKAEISSQVPADQSRELMELKVRLAKEESKVDYLGG